MRNIGICFNNFLYNIASISSHFRRIHSKCIILQALLFLLPPFMPSINKEFLSLHLQAVIQDVAVMGSGMKSVITPTYPQ